MSVSIVIPAYRAAATLARTIESCRSTVRPRDIIVVLDGADEQLEQIARDAAENIRVVVRPEPSGAPACRNAGLAIADTDYVMFLDADDYVEGDFLVGAEATAKTAAADVVLGRFAFEMPDGTRNLQDPLHLYGQPDPGLITRKWLLGGYTPPCAVVWRSAYVRSLGGWDETLAKNQDGDLIYRALMDDCTVAFSTQGLGIYVQDDNPDRITRRQSSRTLASQFKVLEKIRETMWRLPFDPGEELALSYYGLARAAYSIDARDIGTRAEQTARALGLKGQPGSAAHSALATVFGLRGKQRLASLARNLLNP